jgi:hypothetical protein
MRVIFFLMICMICSSARAEAWTNCVGHALEAKLRGIQKSQVTFLKLNGEKMQLHIQSLCKADQKRIRKVYPVKVPESEQNTEEQRQLSRLDVLYKAGRLSKQDYQKERRAVIKHFTGK